MMDTQADKGPTKPTDPLTFSEAMYHYFRMGNELYKLKVQAADPKMIQQLQSVVDALLADITKSADDGGFGKEFRDIIWNERGSEKRTFWIRRTANKLKAAKPSLLSLELLGSAGVVIAVAYYVLHFDSSLSFSCGLVIVVLRLSLPWIMNKIAAHEERKLSELRTRYDSRYSSKAGEQNGR
jgi:hypothetical protein